MPIIDFYSGVIRYLVENYWHKAKGFCLYRSLSGIENVNSSWQSYPSNFKCRSRKYTEPGLGHHCACRCPCIWRCLATCRQLIGNEVRPFYYKFLWIAKNWLTWWRHAKWPTSSHGPPNDNFAHILVRSSLKNKYWKIFAVILFVDLGVAYNQWYSFYKHARLLQRQLYLRYCRNIVDDMLSFSL